MFAVAEVLVIVLASIEFPMIIYIIYIYIRGENVSFTHRSENFNSIFFCFFLSDLLLWQVWLRLRLLDCVDDLKDLMTYPHPSVRLALWPALGALSPLLIKLPAPDLGTAHSTSLVDFMQEWLDHLGDTDYEVRVAVVDALQETFFPVLLRAQLGSPPPHRGDWQVAEQI